jgi:hypothetical protein
MSKIIDSILNVALKEMINLLTEDQILHFNKLHAHLGELKGDRLIEAIDLVERTLKKDGVEYYIHGPNFVKVKDI